MSMNLHVSGEREVVVKKTGHTSIQRINFDLWQTPTSITKEAIRGTDPKAVYVSWVQSRSNDEREPVYAADDIFGEREPVDFVINNSGTNHLNELEEWLAMCDHEGYEVEFYEM